VTADQIYADPSALSHIYLHQIGSRRMVAWRRRTPGSLPVTHHGRVELINAIGLAVYRGEVTVEKAGAARALLADDFTQGHLTQVDILWRAALNRAAELAASLTPELGTRSLDVLHVACALELNLRRFLTFDERQQELATAVGLRLVRVI
jgi:predicted nucleic acid-binding protein